MKIYADENIERSIIDGLRRRKIEVSVGQCIRGVELIVNILTDKDMEKHIEFL